MSWPELEAFLADEAEFEQRDFQPVPAIIAHGRSGNEGTPDRAPVEGGPAVGARAPSGPAFPKPAGIPSPSGRQNTPRASSPVSVTSSMGGARGVLLHDQADCHPYHAAARWVNGRRICVHCLYPEL